MPSGGDEYMWVTTMRYGNPVPPIHLHQEPLDLRPQGSESPPMGDPHAAWAHHSIAPNHQQQQPHPQQQQAPPGSQHMSRRDSFSEASLAHLHLSGCGQHHHHHQVRLFVSYSSSPPTQRFATIVSNVSKWFRC